MSRKGILLAGGTGSRLYPITLGTSKQLLPVYDKPMIYYSLTTLMLAGVTDIVIISTKYDIENYKKLLGDGKNLGLNFEYIVQENPNGIAEVFLLAENFINQSPSVLILGDNLFFGQGFQKKLQDASLNEGATIFSYPVKNPNAYGVATVDKNGKVKSIVEKPKNPKSNLAITGLYFYDENACTYAKSLKPSDRGELEITDLNKIYLEKDLLSLENLGRGFSWLDMGTPELLLKASQMVESVQERQGFFIGCPEEIAYKKGYISDVDILNFAKKYKNTKYGEYIKNLIDV